MTVVVSEQGIVVIAGQERRSVVSIGAQGPAGPPGDVLSFTADGAVGGHRVVVLTSVGVRPVDLSPVAVNITLLRSMAEKSELYQ